MNRNLLKMLDDAKRRGISAAVSACTQVLPLAVYNALTVALPDMEYKQMGDITVSILKNLLETLADANENDTFTEEVRHAAEFAVDRMEIADRIKKVIM